MLNKDLEPIKKEIMRGEPCGEIKENGANIEKYFALHCDAIRSEQFENGHFS